MKRPVHAWLVFFLCSLVVVAALGWITREALRQENLRRQGEAYAEQQELVRLALWRMDSQLSALVVQENARPPEQFRAFARQEIAVGGDLRAWQGPPLLLPSPLIRGPDANVLLHFEWQEDGKVQSPQAPEGTIREAALSNGLPMNVAATCSPLLSDLQIAFRGAEGVKKNEAEKLSLSLGVPAKAAATLNDSLAESLAAKAEPLTLAPQPQAPSPLLSKQSLYNEKEQIARSSLLNSTVTAGNLQSKNKLVADARQDEYRQQEMKRLAEESEQPRLAGLSRSKTANMPALAAQAPPPAPAAVPATAAAAAAEARPGKDSQLAAAPAPQTVPADFFAAAPIMPAAPASTYTGANQLAYRGIKLEPQSRSRSQADPEEAHPFRPLWHDGRLLLIRTVSGNAKPLLQGVWLNWEHLRQSLTASISDLLPAAKLNAVSAALPAGKSVFEQLSKFASSSETATVSDPLQLVSIPVRLDPGPMTAASGPVWTPLRTTLSVAWIGALLAAGAVALLLRGTLALSERRADFVSAVTHELRTPLTTFRMYSEMLASGMVKDEAKSKSYLDTLQSESGRLAHLVENVLRYSRLERGSAKAVVEDVSAGDLLERMWPHLEERAARSGMTVERSLPEELSQARLRVDVGVAEQIFLNLVDNACKYAAPHTDHQVIRIEARAAGRAIEFAVRDYGRGFSAAELKRLFKPFRKSAEKAAHTAEGVGLGLALSRRLARALGGDLTLDRSVSPGACFIARLPRA